METETSCHQYQATASNQFVAHRYASSYSGSYRHGYGYGCEAPPYQATGYGVGVVAARCNYSRLAPTKGLAA